MNMQFIHQLPTPETIKEQFPLHRQIAALKERRDREICDVFTGTSDKLLLIIGPCSADNEEAVIDYISRLRRVQDRVEDRILIIPTCCPMWRWARAR